MTWQDTAAAADIDRMLAAINKPPDHALEYCREIADGNAARENKPFVVIGRAGHYQVWHKWIAERYSDGEYAYVTDG